MSAPHRLFVYGIFLGETTRQYYGMTDPQYAVVKNYATYARNGHIVEAAQVDPSCNAAMAGLVVTVDPKKWDQIDALERDYDRKLVTTTSNQHVYMYVSKEKYAEA